MISTRYKVTILLALLVAACTTDDTATRQQQGLTPIAVSVADIGGQTRASGAGSHLDGTTYNETQFAAGEYVDLFINQNLTTTTSTSTGSYTAGNPIYLKTANVGGNRQFSWYSDDEHTEAMTAYWPASGTLNFYACYPTGAATSSTTGSITVEADDQSTAAGIAASDLLLARAEGVAATPHAVPLQFEHRLSKVVVHLTADDADLADMLCHAKITLGNSDIYTQATFNPTTAAVTTNTNSSAPKATITLKSETDVLTKSGSGTSYTIDKDVYCIIPPQQLSDKTLTITPDDSNNASNNPYRFEPLSYTIAYSPGGTLTTQSAQVYTINVNASSAIPTVPVASIKAWGTENVEATTDYMRTIYQSMPLTIENIHASETATVGFVSPYPNCEYRLSTDGGATWDKTKDEAWTAYNYIDGEEISLLPGYVVQFRAPSAPGNNTTNFKMSGGALEVYGNIMSLGTKEGFESAVDLNAASYGNSAFDHLFTLCAQITDASRLILPATTLTEHCYYGLFNGCENLSKAPALFATELANLCYQEMFKGCKALTVAPSLPATTLKEGCYWSMFSGCTSLSTPPELPATTLGKQCYQQMFEGTALVIAPLLPATTLADDCYAEMFRKCSLLRVAPELPAMTCVKNCYQNMFNDCTSLVTPPALPATTLAANCYKNMFNGCTSLATAPVLAATTLVSNCYYQMFYNCERINEIWCAAKAGMDSSDCLINWLSNTAASGTFHKNPNATTGVSAGASQWQESSGDGIPAGWSIVNDCGE